MMREISPKEADFWERVAEAREKVMTLDPEQQREGQRLNERYHALQSASQHISGEQPILSEHYREAVLEVLSKLTEEADAAYRAYCEETGVPLFRA
jgi:hypothetical protein